MHRRPALSSCTRSTNDYSSIRPFYPLSPISSFIGDKWPHGHVDFSPTDTSNIGILTRSSPIKHVHRRKLSEVYFQALSKHLSIAPAIDQTRSPAPHSGPMNREHEPFSAQPRRKREKQVSLPLSANERYVDEKERESFCSQRVVTLDTLVASSSPMHRKGSTRRREICFVG